MDKFDNELSFPCLNIHKRRVGDHGLEMYKSNSKRNLCVYEGIFIFKSLIYSLATINVYVNRTFDPLQIPNDCSMILIVKAEYLANERFDLCPGICRPVPILMVRQSIFESHSFENLGSVDRLCSASIDELRAKITYHKSLGTSEYSDEPNLAIAESIFWRRLSECYEQSYWADTIPYATQSRLPVQGLVIWVGSENRKDVIAAQISTLQSHTRTNNLSVVSWAAMDDIYGCRPQSTSCKAMAHSVRGPLKRIYKYGMYMPYTRIPRSSFGWNCAQRRYVWKATPSGCGTSPCSYRLRSASMITMCFFKQATARSGPHPTAVRSSVRRTIRR